MPNVVGDGILTFKTLSSSGIMETLLNGGVKSTSIGSPFLCVCLVRMVFDFVATSDVFHHARYHCFSKIHKILIVGVRHVEFAGRELRVVGEVDA